MRKFEPVSYTHLTLSRADDVVQRTAQAGTEMARLGLRILEPDVNYYRGRALMGLGRLDEAFATFQVALNASENIGSRRIRWRILLALTQCAQAQGHVEGAKYFRQRTEDEIAAIAEMLTGLPQHETFLNLVARERERADFPTSNG